MGGRDGEECGCGVIGRSGLMSVRNASSVSARARNAAGDGPVEPFKAAKQSVVEEFERDYLARLLAKTSHNLSRAAALAGVERNHLRDLCRKHGLRSSE